MARKLRNRRRSAGHRFVLALALFVALALPVAARADETPAFLEASASAYAPYRGAMAYLHTGNDGLAALALDAMAARWTALCDRFRTQPPEAFAKDPAWQASLDGITGRIAAARVKARGRRRGRRRDPPRTDTRRSGRLAPAQRYRDPLGPDRRFLGRHDRDLGPSPHPTRHGRRPDPRGACRASAGAAPSLGGCRGRPARRHRGRSAVSAPDCRVPSTASPLSTAPSRRWIGPS